MSATKRLWEDEEERRIADMRSQIAWEYGLHEDDDSDRIEDLVIERLVEEQDRLEMPSRYRKELV